MYRALSNHHFYVVDNNFPFEGRPLPDNAEIIPWPKIPWEKVDLGYAVSYERLVAVKECGKPCVFHIDQVPQQWDNPPKLAKLIKDTPTLYWSHEEASMWQVGTQVVRPHPIDTRIFNGYSPINKSAITIATRAISGWGPDLKGFNVLKEAYSQIPIQVIAKGDQDFQNAHSIESEKEMVQTLRDYQVYFNCAWKLDRSPLEAMGVGMPVVALRTAFNVYKDYFSEEKGNILYAWDTKEMIEKTKRLLEDKELCSTIGVKARATIREFWNPQVAKAGWEKAFELALEL